MNDSPQEATLPPKSAVKKAADWTLKHWARVRLGHEGMMLAKIQRQNRIVEVDARNAMTGTVDDTANWPSSKGDDMGVDIGDTIHNHYYPESLSDELGSEIQTPPTQQPPKPATGSWLKKAALSAALIGSGAGIGAAVPWLLGAFDKPPAVEAQSDRWLDVRTEKWVPPKEE